MMRIPKIVIRLTRNINSLVHKLPNNNAAARQSKDKYDTLLVLLGITDIREMM